MLVRSFEEFGEDFDGPNNVGDGAAAGKVGNCVIKTLEDGSGDSKACKLFKDFVDQITGVKVGSDEDIGLSGNFFSFGALGLMILVKADAGVNRGVELHLPSNEQIALFKAGKCFLNDIDCRILPTTS